MSTLPIFSVTLNQKKVWIIRFREYEVYYHYIYTDPRTAEIVKGKLLAAWRNDIAEMERDLRNSFVLDLIDCKVSELKPEQIAV